MQAETAEAEAARIDGEVQELLREASQEGKTAKQELEAGLAIVKGVAVGCGVEAGIVEKLTATLTEQLQRAYVAGGGTAKPVPADEDVEIEEIEISDEDLRARMQEALGAETFATLGDGVADPAVLRKLMAMPKTVHARRRAREQPPPLLAGGIGPTGALLPPPPAAGLPDPKHQRVGTVQPSERPSG